MTAKDSVETKVKKLTTDNGPAEKTITINFTFKAKDTTLKNNTQTLSVEVKLTKAQKIDNSNKDNVITKILNKIDKQAFIQFQEGPPNKFALFQVNEGTYKDGVYTVKNTTPQSDAKIDKFSDKVKIDDFTQNLDYYPPLLEEIKSFTQSTTKNTEGGAGASSYKVYYDITWDDKYELPVSEIAFLFDLQ